MSRRLSVLGSGRSGNSEPGSHAIHSSIPGTLLSHSQDLSFQADLRTTLSELDVLALLGTEIEEAVESGPVLRSLVRRAATALHAEQVLLYLLQQSETGPQLHLVQIALPDAPVISLPTSFLETVRNTDELRRISASSDQDYGPWPPDIRSVIISPLRAGGQIAGHLVAVNKRKGDEFLEADGRLLRLMGTFAAQISDRSRLLDEEAELETFREDLRLARHIQGALLPAPLPAVPGYECSALNMPAREVGGDYYDLFPLGSDRWAIALGDVAGKSLPASLGMANLQATIRGQAPWCSSASSCIERANDLLVRSTAPGEFVTLLYGVLNLESHHLALVNGGHPPAFIRRADEREFGASPLKELLAHHPEAGPQSLIAEIAEAIAKHRNGALVSDDLTLLSLRRSS